MKFVNKHEKLLTIIFISILSLIPISLAFNNSVWLDEAFSLNWSALPFSEMIKKLINDVHPPLYYFMLYILQRLTFHSLFVAKLFSVVPVILMFLLGYQFVRKHFGRKAEVFFDLFILFMPMMLKKTVEVRMYTWACYFVLLSAVEMYYLLQEKVTKKNWVLFIVFSLCAAYTHYFAMLAMVVVYGGLLVYYVFHKNWKRVGEWFLFSLLTVIGYLPWLPTALKQVAKGGAGWITMPSSKLGLIRDLFETKIPISGNIYLWFLILALLATGILFIIKKEKSIYFALVCMAAVWGELIFGLVYGALFNPIMIPRYLMIPLCLTILGLSSMCRYINKYILIIPCLFFIVTGIVVYQDVFKEEYVTQTDETLKFVDKYVKDEEYIITDAGSLCSVIPYYYPGKTDSGIDTVYSDSYQAVWYFDSDHTLDFERLNQYGIQYKDYGAYGFDNVDFEIYYLYK